MLALCLPPPQGQLLRATGEEALDLDRPVDWSLDLVEKNILGVFEGACSWKLEDKDVIFLLARLADTKAQDIRA